MPKKKLQRARRALFSKSLHHFIFFFETLKCDLKNFGPKLFGGIRTWGEGFNKGKTSLLSILSKRTLAIF